MSRYRRRKEPEFDLTEWELDIYRKTLMVGHWHDAAFLFPRVGLLVPVELFKVLVKAGRKKEPMTIEDVELSEETKALLTERAKAGCVCCRYIVDDWAKNNKLTDYGNFPGEAKLAHIEAEKAGQVA